MEDPGARATDDIFGELEWEIGIEYKQAAREVAETVKDYWRRYEKKDATWKKWVDEEKKTEEEYKAWLQGQLLAGKRWEAMSETLSDELINLTRTAKQIAYGYMPEVYAENHAYGTYEIETGIGVDTSYTIYSKDAIGRLFRENPDLLPGPGKKVSRDIAEGKAKLWEKRHIRSVATQAILQGNSIPDIATRLANAVCDSDRNAAIRNARTMMTGVQNAGRLDAYKRGEDLGVDTKKVWQATLDMRTRHEHRLLDGQARGLDGYFTVEGEKIAYPGDPSASPHLVYGCRCTLIGEVKGWKSMSAPGRSMAKLEDAGLTYDEWKNDRHEITKPWQAPEKRAEAIRAQFIRGYRGFGGEVESGRKTGLDVDSKTAGEYEPKGGQGTPSEAKNKPSQPLSPFASKIYAIKEKVAQKGGKIDEKDILEAGKVLAAEFKEHKRESYEKIISKSKAIENYKEKSGLNQLYYELKHMPDGIYDVNAYRSVRLAKIRKIESDDRYKITVKNLEIAQKNYEGTPKRNSSWLKSMLSEIRDVGINGRDLSDHLTGEKDSKKYLKIAYDLYPSEWLERSIRKGKIDTGMAERGYYYEPKDGKCEIKLSGNSSDQITETAIHELGHRFEHAISDIIEAEKNFYERRTKGETSEWLGGNYSNWEKTKKDKFIHPYIGKDYNGSAYEIVSMGFQYAYFKPTKLAEDSDMQELIYGLLCLI